jgi:putative tryptophan/tyrosine transport system substrate-binding protein
MASSICYMNNIKKYGRKRSMTMESIETGAMYLTLPIRTRVFAMLRQIKKKREAGVILALISFLVIYPALTGYADEKVFTIGVVNSVSILSPAFDGFKSGMKNLGYIEGKNVRYIYNGVIKDDQKSVDDEIRKLQSQKIDLLLAEGNLAALQAKKDLAGAGIPILVGSYWMPVESGLIESMTHPGGNITGVAGLERTAKALEWLKIIMPDLKKVFLPYNPDDTLSVVAISDMNTAMLQIGIEIVFGRVHSAYEAVAVIEKLPENIKAVFFSDTLSDS